MSGDLHCHTKLSDGTLGIEELISLASEMNVGTLGITDHDCMAGGVRAKIIGERKNVEIINGVEISATDETTGEYIQILAYLFDSPDRIEGLCKANSIIRKKAGQIMIKRTCEKFKLPMAIMNKNLNGSTNIYIQHILEALMECGYTDKIYGDLYEKYFTPESPDSLLIKPKYANAKDVLAAVSDAGGISFLAYSKQSTNKQMLDELVESGLNGVEIYTPYTDDASADFLQDYAKKNKMLKIGGSDFHGLYNRGVWTVGECTTPKSDLTEITNYKSKMRRKAKQG